MDKPRLDLLKEILEKDPGDTFTKYALGLEYVSLKRYEDAILVFEDLASNNPEYHATYYQLGKAYEAAGDFEKARKTYEKGIYVAASQNEMHAKDELQLALDELL